MDGRPTEARKLDFVVIGAAKAGTTALFEYVRTHPEIALPREKETAFFAVDDLFNKGWDWYARSFLADLPSDRRYGDISPAYMWGTPYSGNPIHAPVTRPPQPLPSDSVERVVPQRIADTLPRAKVICVLRDPVARAVSHYQMSVLWRWETRDFNAAMEALLEPEQLDESRRWVTGTTWYITLGEYGRILKPYFDLFLPEQMRVVFSTELLLKRHEVLEELFTFLDVDPKWTPPNLDVRYREAATARRIPGLDLYRYRQSLAGSRTLKRMWRLIPSRYRVRADRSFGWATLRLDMWNAIRGNSKIEIDPGIRAALERHFRTDGRLLASLIGREPPWLDDWGSAGSDG